MLYLSSFLTVKKYFQMVGIVNLSTFHPSSFMFLAGKITREEFNWLNTQGVDDYINVLVREHPRFRQRFSEQCYLSMSRAFSNVTHNLRERYISKFHLAFNSFDFDYCLSKLAPSLFLFFICIFRGIIFSSSISSEEKILPHPLKILMKKRNRLGASLLFESLPYRDCS